MTHFGPTRAELKFRLRISIIGLLLICSAVALRGLPSSEQSLTALLAAIVFLLVSACFSQMGLSGLDED